MQTMIKDNAALLKLSCNVLWIPKYTTQSKNISGMRILEDSENNLSIGSGFHRYNKPQCHQEPNVTIQKNKPALFLGLCMKSETNEERKVVRLHVCAHLHSAAAPEESFTCFETGSLTDLESLNRLGCPASKPQGPPCPHPTVLRLQTHTSILG